MTEPPRCPKPPIFKAQMKCQLFCSTLSRPHLCVLRVLSMAVWDTLVYKIIFTCLPVTLSCWTVSLPRPLFLPSTLEPDSHMVALSAYLLTDRGRGPLSAQLVCPFAGVGDGFLSINLLVPYCNLYSQLGNTPFNPLPGEGGWV